MAEIACHCRPTGSRNFLQRLTPLTRGNPLMELERLEGRGSEIPGCAQILDKLRAEFRKDGPTQNRLGNSSRYFFAPLEPLLINSAPEHANSGRVQRGSLAPIWEWISRDLLPTMAREYVNGMNRLIASDNLLGAQQVATTFQIKVLKNLENTLNSPGGADQSRLKLATYTASRAVYDDMIRIQCVLRARDAVAKFNDALPDKLSNLDDARLSKLTTLLNAFGRDHTEAIPFAAGVGGHVLGSRSLRRHQSLAGRLTYLAWRGRDVMTGGAACCRRLTGQPEKFGA
jgi:hypothetical protein